MIIDPHTEGCTIFKDNKVQELRGSAVECCRKIINHVRERCYGNEDQYDVCRFVQWYKGIKVNVTGAGHAYCAILKEYNIEFEEMKVGKII